MKILQVSHLYYPSIGGNQYHNRLMSEKLAQLGEEVHVFTSRATDMEQFYTYDPVVEKLAQEETIHGVHVHRFKINYRFMDFVLQKKIKIRGSYRLFKAVTREAPWIWENGPVTLGMFDAIRRLKPDVIVATNYYFFTSYMCYLAKRCFGIPLVIMPITHVADPHSNAPFLKTMYAHANLLMACTDFEKNYLVRELGQPEEKIAALPLGIDPDIFRGADGAIVRQKYGFAPGLTIGYFGRKVPHKGLETLLDSMELIWQKCPDAQLLLAGQTADYFAPKLQQHIHQYSAAQQQRIININNFPENEKGHFYDAVDIMAMPSNTDCFGLVYLESWASGKPVIACKNTPQETIVRDGIDGLLVGYKNKEELSAAIIRLLNDKNLRLTMGQNGRDIVHTKYNLDVYGKDLRKAYYQVVNKTVPEQEGVH